MAPLAYLVAFAGTRGTAVALEVVTTPPTRWFLWTSLVLTGGVTAAVVPVGVGLAILVARTDLPGRRFWLVAGTLPMALPSFVAASSYRALFPGLDGLPGAGVALGAVLLPFVFLPTAVALRHLDPALADVARSLGDGPLRAFRRAVLPAVRPAVAGGALLVALGVLGDFGAATTMRAHTFTSLIYSSYLAGADLARGAVQSVLLLGCTAVILALEARGRGRGARHRLGPGAARPLVPVALGRLRWPAVVVAVLAVGAAGGLPAAGLVRGLVAAVEAESPVGASVVADAARASAAAAGWAAAAALAAALPVALSAARHRERVGRVAETATYVASALPPLVVGLAVAFLAVRTVPGLYRRLPVLVFAYVVLFLPLAVVALGARAAQLPLALTDVARSLGRSPGVVAATVTAPLLAPAVASSFALVFLAAFKELPVALLIGPFGFETLAILAWEPPAGPPGAPATAATVLVLGGVLATGLLLRMATRRV